jgi:hypothetical protein
LSEELDAFKSEACRSDDCSNCDLDGWCGCLHHWYVQEGEKFDLLCLTCRGEVHLSPGEKKPRRCPECSSQGVPADLNDTVTITLTTHELRILTIWAANWAESIKEGYPDSPQVVYGILDGITIQGVTAPLSMRQELADLRAQFGEVEVINEDGTESDL